ncbi:MAG: hypothetical protein ACRENO_08750 [Thermodesulfobacteriota bacterium]
MKKIDSIEMVRNIRDKQNKDITGKSAKEIIDYFRKKAKKSCREVESSRVK